MTIKFFRNEGAEEGVEVNAEQFRKGGGLGNVLVQVDENPAQVFGTLAHATQVALLTLCFGLTEEEADRGARLATTGAHIRAVRVRVENALKACSEGRLQDMNRDRLALAQELLSATQAAVDADKAWLAVYEER